jgi:hypothetical protein
LKGGAPAFSPNNMRLAMKEQKKGSYQHFEDKGKNKNKKQYKPKYEIQNQQQKAYEELSKKH